MVKVDLNGNTTAHNRAYCLDLLRNIGLQTYERDSVGRIIIHTADGGYICFFEQDEPRISQRLGEKRIRVIDKYDERQEINHI